MPGTVQSALRSLLGAEDKADYVRVVREVALVGGCNCSRVSLVGACLGAKFGMDCIPMEWLEKTEAAVKVLELSIKMVQL